MVKEMSCVNAFLIYRKIFFKNTPSLYKNSHLFTVTTASALKSCLLQLELYNNKSKNVFLKNPLLS